MERHSGKVRLVSAFPVCTDLAASGACWWAGKREADPVFQERAAWRAMQCAEMAEAMGCDAWLVRGEPSRSVESVVAQARSRV